MSFFSFIPNKYCDIKFKRKFKNSLYKKLEIPINKNEVKEGF